MTEQPWPESPYATIRWRLAAPANEDSHEYPDWTPEIGAEVLLRPSISGLVVYDAGTEKITIRPRSVKAVVGASGYLEHRDGTRVKICPTKGPGLSVTGWTWIAQIKNHKIVFTADENSEVDLAAFIKAPATDETQSWVSRIPEMLRIFRGITRIGDVDDAGESTIEFTDGSTQRWQLAPAYPIPRSGESVVEADSDGVLQIPVTKTLATLPSLLEPTLCEVLAPAGGAFNGIAVTLHAPRGAHHLRWPEGVIVHGAPTSEEGFATLLRTQGYWRVIWAGAQQAGPSVYILDHPDGTYEIFGAIDHEGGLLEIPGATEYGEGLLLLPENSMVPPVIDRGGGLYEFPGATVNPDGTLFIPSAVPQPDGTLEF